MRSWHGACLDLVADKKLPLVPGDYVCFNVTGRMFLVVLAEHQTARVTDSDENVGQYLTGIMTYGNVVETKKIWLSWKGYDALWKVFRTKRMV